MSVLVPNRFLFDFEFPLKYRAKLPPLAGRLTGWTDQELLPKLGELDDRPEYADVWACWNEDSLAVAYRVTGKKKPLHCNPREYWRSD